MEQWKISTRKGVSVAIFGVLGVAAVDLPLNPLARAAFIQHGFPTVVDQVSTDRARLLLLRLGMHWNPSR